MDQPADSLHCRGLDATCTGLNVQRLDPAETRAVIGERLIKVRLPTGSARLDLAARSRSCPDGGGSPDGPDRIRAGVATGV